MPSPRFSALVRGILAGGGGGGLPAFAFQAEATALTAAFATPPTARRKRTIDTAIKRLKDAGVWSKLVGMWVMGQDEQCSLLNWVNPAQSLTKVGTPVFVANAGYTASIAGDHLDTGIALTSLSPATCGMFAYTATGADASASDMGGTDSAGNGLGFAVFNSASSALSGRCGGTNVSPIGSAATWTLKSRFNMIARENSTTFAAWRGANRAHTVTNTAAGSFTSGKITLLGIAVNGVVSTASTKQLNIAGVLNSTLTAAQGAVLANVCQQLAYQIQWGEFDIYAPGTSPATVSADLIVYGLTSQGLVAAYEAKRQGLTVAMVGGWRDTEANIGGMSAGGLGAADFLNKSGLGGLPRWIMTQMQGYASKTSTDFLFQPVNFQRATRGMFDPRMTAGQDIPIYLSTGVSSVTKAGARITQITTADGRTFSGTYFVDASYEADMMTRSGVSYFVGREANATYTETLNGWRGNSGGSLIEDWRNAAGAAVNIDPYVTVGVPASGLLPFLESTLPSTTVGTADSRVQAYNFRLTLTSDAARRIPFPSTPPADYDAGDWEGLLRLLAADPTFTFTTLFNTNQVGPSVYDWNNGPGTNMDLQGRGYSDAYPLADYTTREAAWQAHIKYTLGLFYTLQYLVDARVPSALRTSMLTFGLDSLHYSLPNPADPENWNTQLYVREAARMVNDFVYRQTDLIATDGTTPRSTKTISTVSYMIDSHANAMYADLSGTPRIMSEGEMQNTSSGGTDQISPVPYEVIVPRKTECENMAVVFGVAASHVAFGAYRMEFTSMQAAQSAAIAAKIAKTASNQALQDVDYPTLRTALLASATLSGETAPVLPQLN